MLDDRGQPGRPFDLPPGTTATKQSFVMHSWVVTTGTYACVALFDPPGEVTIG